MMFPPPSPSSDGGGFGVAIARPMVRDPLPAVNFGWQGDSSGRARPEAACLDPHRLAWLMSMPSDCAREVTDVRVQPLRRLAVALTIGTVWLATDVVLARADTFITTGTGAVTGAYDPTGGAICRMVGWTMADCALASEIKAAERAQALADNRIDAIG